MIEISVSEPGVPAWRRTFVTASIVIGPAQGHQLILAGRGVRPQHAVIVRTDAHQLVVVPQRGNVRIGGAMVKGERKLGPRDEIGIGAYTLRATARVPQPIGEDVVTIRDAAEQRLLDAIAGGDEASRLVYADWLEGRGEHAQAEWLRVQHEVTQLDPDDPRFEARSDRLREIAAATPLVWRARVAHRTIEGCAQFDFACPKAWDALAPTAREGVRHCSSCNKTVHYSASIDEARAHAAAGRCIALDITSPRLPDDLAAPFGEHLCPSCGVDAGATAAHCPRCGTSMRTMLRGLYLG